MPIGATAGRLLGWGGRKLKGLGQLAYTGDPSRRTGAFQAGYSISEFLKTPSKARTALAVGGASATGYLTADSDADPGQKFGRALGFGIGAKWIGGRWADKKFLYHGARELGRAAMLVPKAGAQQAMRTYARQGTRDIMRGLGVKRFGLRQAMGAGAMYGLISDDITAVGGTLGAAGIYGGVRATSGIISRGRWGDPFRKGLSLRERARAVAALPLATGGAVVGGTMGVMGNMDEGAGAAVMGGVRGGAIGLGVGGLAKIAINRPLMTMAGLGAAGMVVPPAAEAAAIHASAQADYQMEADGDLALALHRNRHSF
jgi:hypothetical protein